MDCDDFGCSKSEDAAVLAVCGLAPESDLSACQDGVDNDGDGFVDCDDFGCSKSEDPNVAALCAGS